MLLATDAPIYFELLVLAGAMVLVILTYVCATRVWSLVQLQSARPASEESRSIDTLRGGAVIMMVLGHVIGGDAKAGLEVAENSFARYSYYSFASLRMPLFTVLSGMLFAMKPPSSLGLRVFAASKVRRLLIPLLTVSFLFAATRWLTAGGESPFDLMTIWVMPYVHFWFLQSLICILVVFGALDLLGAFKGKQRTAIALLSISLIAWLAPVWTTVFSLHNAAALAPMFALGIALVRFRHLVARREVLAVLCIILAGGIGAQQWAWWSGRPELNGRWLGLLVGISGCALLVGLRPIWKPLAQIGAYAYTIYLFHVFFTAATREAMFKVGINSIAFHCLVGTAAGVCGSIVVHHVAMLTPITRVAFLGLRWKKPKLPANRGSIRIVKTRPEPELAGSH